jgi:CHAT domain-containing protein/tetratricopeptide (TPR) repeat protein
MSLLQIKKPTFHIILAFLIIVLLSFHIQVQAKNMDEKEMAQALLTEGIDAFCELDYLTALEKFNNSLTIYREIGDRESEANILQHIGESYLLKGEFPKSLEYHNKALKIFQQLDDKKGMASSMKYIGGVYSHQGDYSNAQAFDERALILYQDIGDKENEALAASSLGNDYRLLGSLDIALKYFNQALDTIKELGNLPYLEGLQYYGIGQLYSIMGDNKEALEAYNKAMQIFEKQNDIILQGNVLIEIGIVNRNMGNYLEAISNLEKGFKIFENPTDDIITDSTRASSQRKALNTLADIYEKIGDNEKAKEYDLKRKEIQGSHYNIKIRQMYSFVEYGNLFFKEKRFNKALENYQQALALCKEIGEKQGEGKLLSGIGDSYRNLGKYSKALGYFKQALKVSNEQKEKNTKLEVLFYIASTYELQQDYQNAIEYYKQASIVAKEIGDSHNESYCFFMMGGVYKKQKKYEKEVEYKEKALMLSKEMNEQDTTWYFQYSLGLSAERSKQLQKAKGYYSESIKTIESIRGKISVEEYKTSFIEDKLSVYKDLIYVLLQLEENEEAFNYVERAKSRSLLDLLGNRLKLKEGKDKDLSQEEMRLQKKIKGILDKIQKEHSQPNKKQRKNLKEWDRELKKTRKQYAKHLLRLKQNNPELHSLVSVNPLTLKEVQELIDSDTTLLEYYAIEIEDTLYIIIWIVDNTNCEVVIQYFTMPSSLSELTSDISAFRKKIATLQPDYEKDAEYLYDTFIRPVKPYIKTKRICIVPYSVLHYLPFHALINVPEICGIGAMLNVDNEILTIASTVEGASASEAGFKPGDKIIEIGEDATMNMSLQEAVSRLKGKPYTTVLLTIEEGESKTRKKVALKRGIFEKSNDYSFIVSDTKRKELKSPRFLIEEYDIFYAPSASVLKFVLEKRKESSGKVLAFGNPELGDEDLSLPHAEEEVSKIKANYPEADIYLNENATEEKAKLLSGNYDIIHFAGHGELNPESPLFSSIRLAKEKDEDGRLEVHEIFNLNLDNASLVTLSACETGLGKLTSGDELIGLTRGFIYAGTPSIVASLWNVNDKSTSDLMGLFYKNLKTHSKIEALRMAQLEMINGEVGRGIVRGVGGITTSNSKEDNDRSQTSRTVNGSHPYFWAPFILLGDWK